MFLIWLYLGAGGGRLETKQFIQITVSLIYWPIHLDMQHGAKALLFAVHRGNMGIVELLIKYGAKADNQTKVRSSESRLCIGTCEQISSHQYHHLEYHSKCLSRLGLYPTPLHTGRPDSANWGSASRSFWACGTVAKTWRKQKPPVRGETRLREWW